MNHSTLTLLCFLFLSLSPAARATTWTREEYFAFRETIELSRSDSAALDATAAEEYTLPTSRGYDQAKSALCWAYATLNVIESDYLKGHPGSPIALSRSAVQRTNMDQHYRSWIATSGKADGCWECGNVPGALGLFLSLGMYDLADYRPAPAPTPWTLPFPIEAKDAKDKYDELGKKLDVTYGALPPKTHSADHSRAITPLELTHEVVGTGEWVHEFTPTKYAEFIRASLKSGHAIVVFWGGHLEEIYGATFDEKGALTQMKIKGSYGPRFLYPVEATAALKRVYWLSRAARFL